MIGCANERPIRKTLCQLPKGHTGSHQAVIYWEDSLCNSQERNSEKSFPLNKESVSCEHKTTGEGKSSPVQNPKIELPNGLVDYILNGNPKKCTCYDEKIEVNDNLEIINKCGRCGGEL